MTPIKHTADGPPYPRLALAGGLAESERDVVRALLSRSLDRLGQRPGTSVELSVKGRDGSQMATTLEVWSPRLPRIVATSAHRDLRGALTEIDRRVLTRLEEHLGRRRPRESRRHRGTIRQPGQPTA